MYRQANDWEDALRVAKVYGGVNASKQVAYAWALTLGEWVGGWVKGCLHACCSKGAGGWQGGGRGGGAGRRLGDGMGAEAGFELTPAHAAAARLRVGSESRLRLLALPPFAPRSQHHPQPPAHFPPRSAPGGDEGAAMLKKMGLLDQAIEYAVESGAFAQAFEMTRAGAKHKLPEVHLK